MYSNINDLEIYLLVTLIALEFLNFGYVMLYQLIFGTSDVNAPNVPTGTAHNDMNSMQFIESTKTSAHHHDG